MDSLKFIELLVCFFVLVRWGEFGGKRVLENYSFKVWFIFSLGEM